VSASPSQAAPGLKRLDEARLRPGDIILVTSSSKLSTAIRVATRSDVSHAMVYVEDRSVIDATDEGVQAGNTQRLFIEDSCPVYALRVRGGMSAAQLDAVRTYLRGHVGTRYSKKEAALTMLGGARRSSRQQFCSRLVAQAFASAGIPLVADPNFCAPADLKASPLLEPIPEATLAVTAEEAAWWEGHEDVPQLMRDAINAVLDGARARNPDIETFDDLHVHLLAHPEQDEEMCRLLETSGYLSIWRIERDKNPWQYDLAALSGAPAPDAEAYCRSVLANEDGGPNRYVINRGAYVLLAHQHGLAFFHVMADLYERLATLHRQRVRVATEWLDANGQMVSPASPPLASHSAAWFAALEPWNPVQAMMTRAIIETVGRTDICSVCGDDPAADYRLAEAFRPAGGVDTLRLCDDCLEIRRASGEPFVPLPRADGGHDPVDPS
jgi:hypothetical protein